MLILITHEELNKFPHDEYTEAIPPLLPELIKEAPYRFNLLSQRMTDYLLCGKVTGDIAMFKASGIVYEEVADIPMGVSQWVLPPQYGEFLTLTQIDTGQRLEKQAMQKTQADVEYISIMSGIDLEV